MAPNRSSSVSDEPNPTPPTHQSKLPLRKIPGGYGPPILGPWKDRQDYFYKQGQEEFFKSRIRLYNSTVFKANMPPGPFISSHSGVIVLLDSASFPVLFDLDLVEKKDVFTGTYTPSTNLTGGFRVLSYLDVREPNHAYLKKLLFYMLSSRKQFVIPEFTSAFGELFQKMESDIEKSGKADFNEANDQASFNFLVRALLGKDPLGSTLGSDGPKIITKWLGIQLAPIATLGLPSLVEDFLLHYFRLPSFLVKKGYERLVDFFRNASEPLLEEADKMGISREEALHNVLFAVCFNSFGGMKVLLPSLVKWVGQAGSGLHGKLAAEVRAAVKSNGGELTMKAMEEMPLVKSVVYEVLRIEPPVQFQYGKARRDFLLESHDACFEVQAGEMLFGYQPFVTRDPRAFERAEEFVADRFVGDKGEKLLRQVLWSNGRETETPTDKNKQCAGKDFVVMVARMMVAELFLRYDTFEIECGTSPLGSTVKFTSLTKKATF